MEVNVQTMMSQHSCLHIPLLVYAVLPEQHILCMNLMQLALRIQIERFGQLLIHSISIHFLCIIVVVDSTIGPAYSYKWRIPTHHFIYKVLKEFKPSLWKLATMDKKFSPWNLTPSTTLRPRISNISTKYFQVTSDELQNVKFVNKMQGGPW